MSDPYNPTMSGQRQDTPADPTLRRAGEDLRATAREARVAAGEAAETVKSEAMAAAQTLKQEGVNLLDNARSRAEEMAQQGTRAGADQVQGLARAIHRAADELEGDSPQIARLVHSAAGSVDDIAGSLRNKSPGEMYRAVEAFARRQPVAFFGAAALAGFALARFARSSASDRTPGYDAPEPYGRYRAGMSGTQSSTGTDHPHAPQHGSGLSGSSHETAAGAPGWVADENGIQRPATLASASLGGAAAMQSNDDTKPYRGRGGSENG